MSMLASGGFGVLLVIAVWLYAIFDALTTPEEKIRGLQKPLWMLVILIGFVLGAVAWFVFGRPRTGQLRGFGGQSAQRRPRTIAPDDDPDFLRSLNRPRDGNGPGPSA